MTESTRAAFYILCDNRYIEREITLYGYDSSWLEEENKLINTAVNIAEHKYKDAASWLKHSKRQTSTWGWYDRDPFCLKIGWSTPNRHLISKSPDYKLNFAKRMVELQDQMKYGETINKRAEAMILYGVGIRNQSDWCWALSRFSDSCFLHDELVNYKQSKSLIDKGLATMTDIELKAYYLHSFARNKDVMDLCPGTKTAKSLRAHCDLWHDYK